MENKKGDPIYIIDTCSLMSPGAEIFLKSFSKKEKLIVPKSVCQEIEIKLTEKDKKKEYIKAKRASRLIVQYKHKMAFINFSAAKKDERYFNDMYMFSFINLYREKNTIFFITQDKDLAKSIVCLNMLKFMHKANRVIVRKIVEEGDKIGELDRFWFDTYPLSWKLLDPEIERPSDPDSNAYVAEEYGTPVRSVRDIFNSIDEKRKKMKNSKGKYKKDKNGEWIPPQVQKEQRGYHLADGTFLPQGKRIGGGGEGEVYQIDDSDLLMKLYKDGCGYDDHGTYQKLLEMTNHPFSYPGICFPIDIVYDAENKFAGYTMEAAKGRSLKTTVLGKRKALRYFGEDFKKTDQIDICMQILEKIDYIHHHNMLVGDLSANNIMVDQDKIVYVIDTDSFQIDKKFKCSVGTREYVPPELIGKNFTEFFRTEDNENFSIALLLFHILVGGAYPYSQVEDENQTYDDQTMADRTIHGVFPYYFPNRKGEKNATPLEGGYRYFWSHLTRNIKNMFGETFHSEGERFRENRYTVSDWIKSLKRYKHYLTTDDEKYAKNRDPADLEAFPLQYKVVDEDLLDEGKYITCNVCGKKTLNIYAVGARCLNCTNKVMHRRGDPMAPTCRICHKWIPYTYRQYDRNEPIPTLCDECKADIKSGLIDKNGNPL